MSKNAYAFTYDQLYRLTNSDFGTLTGTSTYNFSAASGSKHKETIGGYDKNGNITSLQRRDKDGTLTGDYDYVYHTASNKLDKINHSSSLLVDYTYNAIGQMTQQSEGGKTMNVAYNAYGLVKSIRNGSNQLMQEYFYDDQGNRFMSKIYYNGTLGRTLYYIHDAGGNVLAIYEKVGSTTTLIEVPIYASGRIATYKPQVNTYFYEVSDHLGNVRAVIGAPATDTYRATMESENSTLEEAPAGNFKNIAARRVTFVGANVTTNYTNSLGTPVIGNEVIRVNNTAPAGPGISLAVSPGDKLSAEVWAYYESGSSYNSMIAVSTMVTAIAGAFGGVSGAPGEAGQIYDDINSGVSSYIGNESGTTQPAAYLQYIVFDANRNPTGQKGFFRVTTASNMAKAKIPMPEITIEQPGFVYIFVYNRSDSPNWVFFDEMVVNHEHSSIVAGADYYPFGLVMNGREITDEPYRWGYQGQYAQENDSTGWNEFQLRMYDARFGRWLSADPYGQFWSPYVGMGDVPNMGVDPDGGLLSPIVRYGIAFGVGSVIGGASTGTIDGAILGGIGGMALYGGISNFSAISASVSKVGNWLTTKGSSILASTAREAWVLYNGQQLQWYNGKFGASIESTLVQTYKATSGAPGYQDTRAQNIKDAGPVPEGNYSINLVPDPNRIAKQLPDGRLTSRPEGGIEKIPTEFNGRRVAYPDWGTIRAKLDPLSGTQTYGRHSFYLHNSHKGYSSGCVECENGFFTRLLEFRSMNLHKIKRLKVKVAYQFPFTNGGTKY